MAAFEVVALNTSTPQLRAPGSSDTYTMPRSTAIAIGTQTTDIKVLDLSATWNAGGVTFTALKLNVTNTASAAASMLMDLQVASTTEFSVRSDGQVVSGYTAQNAPSYSFAGDTTTGWGYRGAGALSVILSGGEYIRFTSSALYGLSAIQFYTAVATAIPAGGSTTFGFTATSTANFGMFFGSGAPSLSAAKGSIYLRSDGSATNNRMYVNTDGGTTWTAVTTVA